MIRPLNLPPAKLELSRKDEVLSVKCLVRKKKLVLTPEEWVRQHIVASLVHDFSIPLARIAVETNLSYNGRKKRADIVVYDAYGKPELLVECKAPEIMLSSETLFQIAQYNAVYGARSLIVSNGVNHFTLSLGERIEIESGFLGKFSDEPRG